MIDVIKSRDRHFSDFGWLKTYWLFSFSSYYDPQNIQFGALRVFNDDVVEPGTGFATHPHEEMEIITIVLEGQMTHKDSMGNTTVIRAGDVQRMSAGTGLTHSEYNLAAKPVHFYQIWIIPDRSGLAPTYDQRNYQPDQWKNRLLPVASGQQMEDVVTFHTDATIYRCDLEQGNRITYASAPHRRIFIYLTKGRLSANGRSLAEKDQARIEKEGSLVLEAGMDAELVLIDVPPCDS